MDTAMQQATAFGALLRQNPQAARFYDSCTPQQRQAILEQLSAKLNEICSQVPLYQPLTLRAYDSGLQGVEVSDSGTLYFEDVYWEE